ncbi:MAG: hypothetical protein IPN49_08200 [Saprospiraceae bacterium]|nr:hypothetical protein [Saprospiraceae bacterium]
MTLNKEILNIATYEAIHWWRRDEYFYHKIFSRIPEFKLNVDDLNYFTNFFLKQFARQYSVHRTIKNPNYSKLLDRLLKNGYIDSVINGEVTAIDSIIDVLPPEWVHGRPVSF